MNGRDFFKRYSDELKILENIYNYFPNVLERSIYSIMPSKNLRLFLRYLDIRKSGNTIGKNVYIAENVILKNKQHLTIGDNFSIHEFSYIDAIGNIKIGDNVSIAHNCSIVSFEHTWKDNEVSIKYNPIKKKPIIIGDDIWIGCGVRVLSGTIIESRVVIAAGSVVKGTLESGFLYGGVPVKKIKKL